VFGELGRRLESGRGWQTIWASLSRGLFGFALAIVLAVNSTGDDLRTLAPS